MRSQNTDQVVTRPPSSLCILTKARKSPFLPEGLSVVKWSLRFYQWSGHSFGWYFSTKKKKVKKWEADLISQQLFILHRLLRNLVEVLWHVSWSKKYTHKDLAFALHNRLPVLSVVSECVSTVVFQVSWSRSIRTKYEQGFSSMSHTWDLRVDRSMCVWQGEWGWAPHKADNEKTVFGFVFLYSFVWGHILRGIKSQMQQWTSSRF